MKKLKSHSHSYSKPQKPVSSRIIFKTLLKAILLSAWVGLVVIGAQLVVAYLMIWLFGRQTVSEPVPTAIYSALAYILAFVILLFVTPKLLTIFKHPDTIMKRNDLGLRGLPTWTDIGLAPVGLIVSVALAALLTTIFGLIFPWFNAEQAQTLGFSTYITGGDRIIAFIVLVLVAPIAEELIFRGWLYGKLRISLLGKIPERLAIAISILLVSLLFGILHGQWNVGITVFVMSVVMCILREITGTIYAGTLLHMLKNALAFYLLYVVGFGM